MRNGTNQKCNPFAFALCGPCDERARTYTDNTARLESGSWTDDERAGACVRVRVCVCVREFACARARTRVYVWVCARVPARVCESRSRWRAAGRPPRRAAGRVGVQRRTRSHQESAATRHRRREPVDDGGGWVATVVGGGDSVTTYVEPSPLPPRTSPTNPRRAGRGGPLRWQRRRVVFPGIPRPPPTPRPPQPCSEPTRRVVAKSSVVSHPRRRTVSPPPPPPQLVNFFRNFFFFFVFFFCSLVVRVSSRPSLRRRFHTATRTRTRRLSD